jgi:hypothetical protein
VTSPQATLDAIAAEAISLFGRRDVLINAGYTQFWLPETMQYVLLSSLKSLFPFFYPTSHSSIT